MSIKNDIENRNIKKIQNLSISLYILFTLFLTKNITCRHFIYLTYYIWYQILKQLYQLEDQNKAWVGHRSTNQHKDIIRLRLRTGCSFNGDLMMILNQSDQKKKDLDYLSRVDGRCGFMGRVIIWLLRPDTIEWWWAPICKYWLSACFQDTGQGPSQHQND